MKKNKEDIGSNELVSIEEQKLPREIQREELKRLDRIEYALYNDGQTGLINKVDALMVNQQVIKTDIEVVKAVYESGR